jgi:alpha-galactosidase
MSEAMAFIREVCGDKKVLGCGVPLGPSYGQVDYCRIGADIGLKWDLKSAGNVHMRESISTVNSIKDTIHRRHLNGHAFLNDPDVFILRDKKNKLKAHQKYTLFLINHIFGGLVFTSDNINEYDEATLDLYKSVFPHQEKAFLYANVENELYEIAFKVGESEYFVLANLSKKPVTGKLPGGKYYYRERGFTPGHGNVDLEAFQSLCFLKCPEEPYKVAGGNTHLFPGSEVEKVSKSGDGIEVNIHPQTLRKGHVYITIPEQNHRIDVNGQDMPSEKIYGLKMVKVEFGGGD